MSRMLGFAGGTNTEESYFGDVQTTDFIMNDVACSGSEKSLEDCPHHWPSHEDFTECDEDEAAGVICSDENTGKPIKGRSITRASRTWNVEPLQ